MSKETFVNKIRPHDSAYKHVSGFAEYTDDIKELIHTHRARDFEILGYPKNVLEHRE